MSEAMPQPMSRESGPPEEDKVTTPDYTGQVGLAEEFLAKPEEIVIAVANDNGANPEEAPAAAAESLPSRKEVLDMLRNFTANDGTRAGLEAVLTTILGQGVRFLRRRPNSSAEDVVDIDKLITEIQGGGPLPTYNEPDDLHRALQTVRDLELDGRVEEVSNGEAMASPEVEAAPAVQEQLHAFASRLEPFAVTDVVALLRTMPEMLPPNVMGKNPVDRDALIASLEAGERPIATGNTAINSIVMVLKELEQTNVPASESVPEAVVESGSGDGEVGEGVVEAERSSLDTLQAEIEEIASALGENAAPQEESNAPVEEEVPQTEIVELVPDPRHTNGEQVDGNARLTQLSNALQEAGIRSNGAKELLWRILNDERTILIQPGTAGGYSRYRDAVLSKIKYTRLSPDEQSAVHQALNELARTMRLIE